MSDAALLVQAAAGRDESAWSELVALFGPRLWAVARSSGLGEADAADAVQGAWLRLLENLDSIREPSRVGAWLVTATRREAFRLSRGNGPGRPFPPSTPIEPHPESALLEADAVRRLWDLVTGLPEPCATLLTLLATDAGTSQAAVRMGIPTGSVGPTRSRCLDKLRTRLIP